MRIVCLGIVLLASLPATAWTHRVDEPAPAPQPPPPIPRAVLTPADRWRDLLQSRTGTFDDARAAQLMEALDRIDAEPGNWRDLAEDLYAQINVNDPQDGRASAARLIERLRQRDADTGRDRAALADVLQNIFDKKAEAYAAEMLGALRRDRRLANPAMAEDPQMVRALADVLTGRARPGNEDSPATVQRLLAGTTPEGLRWMFENARVPKSVSEKVVTLAQQGYHANRAMLPDAYVAQLDEIEGMLRPPEGAPGAAAAAGDRLRRLVTHLKDTSPAFENNDSSHVMRMLGLSPWGDFLKNAPNFSLASASAAPTVPPSARWRGNGPEAPLPERAPASDRPPESFVWMPPYQPPPLLAPSSGGFVTRSPRMRWQFPILRRIFRRR